MNNIKKLIEKELCDKLGKNTYCTPNYFEKPIIIGDQLERIKKQHFLIKDFFATVSNIARKSLFENNENLIKLLFSESPAGMTVEYHNKLPDCCWNIPIIYRTDQSLTGKIYEIQSPGSGWGDLYLYSICYKKMGYDIPSYLLNFPQKYVDNIINATKVNIPKVFHMTDAASVPFSMRYLMAITNNIHYWGLSEDVTMSEINCLISHSVISIVTSNFFNNYLKKACTEDFIFAIPPNLIYDEKIVYLLPFYRETSNLFSQEVKSLFPFTTLIENDGFYDENNNFITIKDFAKRPSRERKYFLKYGGPDTNRNWGSRSVYRLSKNDCLNILTQASNLAKTGEVWIIQKDVSKDLPETLSNDLDHIVSSQKKHVKISGYYGINDLMGVKVMARNHFKVHGQNDTYVGIGI